MTSAVAQPFELRTPGKPRWWERQDWRVPKGWGTPERLDLIKRVHERRSRAGVVGGIGSVLAFDLCDDEPVVLTTNVGGHRLLTPGALLHDSSAVNVRFLGEALVYLGASRVRCLGCRRWRWVEPGHLPVCSLKCRQKTWDRRIRRSRGMCETPAGEPDDG